MSIFARTRPLTSAGWGASIIEDIDGLTPENCKRLGQLAARELVVVLRNQNLSTDEEVRICNQIGRVERLPSEIFHRCPQNSSGELYTDIQRVTGERDSQGRPTGLFYHNEDLDWHVNRASSFENRMPLVWLRAVKGVEGSRTSWINTQAAFQDLSGSVKQRLRGMSGFFGYKSGHYSPVTDFKDHVNKVPFPVVYKNPVNGREALYFPFHQIFGIQGMSETEFSGLAAELKDHLLQDKYIYHHDWKDGDIVLSEQWCTLHKRWSFDVSNRLLHRVTMDYEGYQQPGL